MSNWNKSIEKTDNSLQSLIRYVEEEKFMGYDPYDTLNSPLLEKLPGSLPKFVVLQIQKRNPINLRQILGIKKSYVHKGMALFLNSFSRLAHAERKNGNSDTYTNYKSNCDFIYKWLLENRTNGYNGSSWAIHFPIAKVNSVRQKNDPSSVLASFVGDALFEYYKAFKYEKVVELMKDIAVFILSHIPKTETNDGICFSYTTKNTDIVFNANMHVARFFSQLYYITSDKDYLSIADNCVRFTIKHQKADGRWVYSTDLKNKERHQYDFHQGFIIDCLFDYIQLTNKKDLGLITALGSAAEYYRNILFYDNGTSLWRYPQKWPIDIHNQAQGIITFSKISILLPKYFEFAHVIAKWTIENMQSEKGYFYHQKWPFITNKISYIRWGQAWMLLALTTLKTNQE
jgi:hypothetical protein